MKPRDHLCPLEERVNMLDGTKKNQVLLRETIPVSTIAKINFDL